jgi:uncharacterized protein
MLRVIRQNQLIEGRWRNGMGTSWEIASHKKAGAEDFSWRFAKARIDGDVPFSMYPGMDRIFMMLDGDGMDLEFANGEVLQVHERFVPHKFACDVPLNCKLLGRPSIDLNLFAAREELRLECEVLNFSAMNTIKLGSGATVLYVLEGEAFVSGEKLNQDDSAVVTDEIEIICNGQNALLYIGRLNLL